MAALRKPGITAATETRRRRWIANVPAGDLRTFCELQKPAQTVLTGGSQKDDWTTIDEIWGNVLPYTEERVHYGGAVQDILYAYVKIRYRNDVLIGWRLVTDTAVFTVFKEPLDLEFRHCVLLLPCRQS